MDATTRVAGAVDDGVVAPSVPSSSLSWLHASSSVLGGVVEEHAPGSVAIVRPRVLELLASLHCFSAEPCESLHASGLHPGVLRPGRSPASRSAAGAEPVDLRDNITAGTAAGGLGVGRIISRVEAPERARAGGAGASAPPPEVGEADLMRAALAGGIDPDVFRSLPRSIQLELTAREAVNGDPVALSHPHPELSGGSDEVVAPARPARVRSASRSGGGQDAPAALEISLADGIPGPYPAPVLRSVELPAPLVEWDALPALLRLLYVAKPALYQRTLFHVVWNISAHAASRSFVIDMIVGLLFGGSGAAILPQLIAGSAQGHLALCPPEVVARFSPLDDTRPFPPSSMYGVDLSAGAAESVLSLDDLSASAGVDLVPPTVVLQRLLELLSHLSKVSEHIDRIWRCFATRLVVTTSRRPPDPTPFFTGSFLTLHHSSLHSRQLSQTTWTGMLGLIDPARCSASGVRVALGASAFMAARCLQNVKLTLSKRRVSLSVLIRQSVRTMWICSPQVQRMLGSTAYPLFRLL